MLLPANPTMEKANMFLNLLVFSPLIGVLVPFRSAKGILSLGLRNSGSAETMVEATVKKSLAKFF